MNEVEEIRERLDIVDVVKDYIKLKKTGANYSAPCPFHSEEKPSFFVSKTKQIWKCFGCGLGGSVFDFVMEIEGVDFRGALEILARKAGVELKQVSPEERDKKQRLYNICELATKFYQKQLESSSVGDRVKGYLEERGIDEDSISDWRLSYSPDKWGALTNFLLSRGYQKREIVKTGLGVLSKKGRFYDRFRGRIMFPVFDIHDRVIGFGGRVFEEEDTAKYLNTPNTPLYNKSRVLYGINRARVETRKKDFCIVAEGYTDVILSNQVGISNIVSSSGTALTPQQLGVLKRYTSNLYFAFDMDQAGEGATKRAIREAQKRGFNVKIILMPEGHDPADLIDQKGKEGWQEALDNSRGVVEFYLETSLDRFDEKTPEGKASIAEDVLPVIKPISNEIVRFHWIQELSEVLGVTEKSIQKELGKIEVERETRKRKPKKREARSLERDLLLFLAQDPTVVEKIEEVRWLSDEMKEFIQKLKEAEGDFEKMELPDEVQEARLRVEVMGEVENPGEEVAKCLNRIEKKKKKEEMRVLSSRIKAAERSGDDKGAKELTKEFNNYLKNGSRRKKEY